jgi:hypothetical protein
MRKSVYLMIASFPILFLGGVTGSYFLKTLAVLAFVSGALGFLWYGIQHAMHQDAEREKEEQEIH